MKVIRPFNLQPCWQEPPYDNGEGWWGGRYIITEYSCAGEPEQTVAEDWHKAPDDIPGATPVEKDGVWVWVL